MCRRFADLIERLFPTELIAAKASKELSGDAVSMGARYEVGITRRVCVIGDSALSGAAAPRPEASLTELTQ